MNASRQYWFYGLIMALIISIVLNFTDLENLFMRPNEGFVSIYDIHRIITICGVPTSWRSNRNVPQVDGRCNTFCDYHGRNCSGARYGTVNYRGIKHFATNLLNT